MNMNMNTSILGTTISALALMTSISSHAASITTHDDLNVASINGKNVKFEKLVGLQEGATLIELTYHDLFQDHADDSGHWVRSDPLYLKLNLSANQQYHLTPPDIDNVDEARAFLAQPQVHIHVNGQSKQTVNLMTQSQLLTQLLID
ncbi:DUF2057 family protein [Shewanella intestini]|uniref:DUF2057 domain-containing protein n=1 Tax=Shewanella intestini TaxID=2017544 RepID=A0ABS5I561_9GAMM|nr:MULTISPECIES: DUF2057 family protein [Shewanella]MBR9729165.1 DUF2057 domain-containing protein [Shewanella intestini]